MKKLFIIISLGLSLVQAGLAQLDLPKIFLDCQTNCHEFYVRQELTYLDYMRERQNADLYILVTSQRASAGAQEYQLIFQYDGYDFIPSDTLKYIEEANISLNDQRDLFVKSLKQGLLPALVNSSLSDRIEFEIPNKEGESDINNTPVHDPWNFWSFNTSVNVNVSAEQSFNEQNYFLRQTSSRVTEDAKIFVMARFSLNQSSFTLSDGEEVSSRNERYRGFFQYVRSINDHWSAGFRTFAGSSTFSNIDFDWAAKPAVEYNIYPYSENSTKRFTIFYSMGYVFQDYTELTVFDKLNESLWQQSVNVEFQQTQKWGDLSMDIEFDQYLHDISLYSISFNPNVELNIVKGLRLNFGGYIEFVGDRISITKSDVSAEDIILQNRQLDTNYSFWTYFGFNYRFGSANNNIVNPRF